MVHVHVVTVLLEYLTASLEYLYLLYAFLGGERALSGSTTDR